MEPFKTSYCTMKTILSVLLILCLNPDVLAMTRYRRHARPHGHRHPGRRPPTPTSTTSITVNMEPGSSRIIESTNLATLTPDYRRQIWNIEARDSSITAMCFLHLPGPRWNKSCFTVGGTLTCRGIMDLEAITTENRMEISFTTRGGNNRFKCFVVCQKSGGESEPVADWSYSGDNGPNQWTSKYPSCAGANQSPIDIQTSSVLGQFPWKEMGLQGYENPTFTMTLKNTGNAVVLTADGPFVMGGNLPLNVQFILSYVVFHWGSSDGDGSEHTVDGARFAGEVQFIHYNKKYNDYESASGQSDGLVALSVLLQISQNDNNDLSPVVGALANIQKPGASTTVTQFPLSNLLPGNYNEYYRYNGSLTQPGCDEPVVWTVFRDSVSISSNQLQQFRSVEGRDGNLIFSNIRPVQDLNGRSVLAGQLKPTWSHLGPDGQDVWATRISSTCAGQKQSPVNIDTASTVVESSWSPLIFKNFDQVPENMTIENSDHGATIEPNRNLGATIEGGPFESPYLFFTYHFHWGSPTSSGSEHTLDGRRYAGEIHMLIYREDVGGLFQSLGVKSAFLEVAMFLELSENDNPKLDSVIKGLANIIPSEAKTDLTPFPLDYLLPENTQDYFYYDGSLSAPVPTCNELVDFMVFKESVPISRDQISQFFKLENAAGRKILNSFRRLQDLNGRTIFRSP